MSISELQRKIKELENPSTDSGHREWRTAKRKTLYAMPVTMTLVQEKLITFAPINRPKI